MGQKSIRKNLLFWGAIFAIALTFALPEISLYKNVDRFDTPMRLYRGDVLHYFGILNAGRVNGGPSANAYFAEWSDGLSNFELLQAVVRFVPGVEHLSIVWLAQVFKILAAILVFIFLTRLLRYFDVPQNIARIWSFVFVLLFGPMAFQGSALAGWFFPFLILGTHLTLRFYLEENSFSKNIKLLVGALVCFSLQPVYFFLGMGFTGLLWLLKLKEDRSKEKLKLFGIWILAALAVFLVLFFPFMSGKLEGSKDILLRFVSSYTRVPFHPLLSLRFVVLAVISAVVLWRHKFDDLYRRKWTAVGVISLMTFLAIDSYLITGNYVANDHYIIIEDILAFIFFIITLQLPGTHFKGRKVIGWLLLVTTLFSIYDIGLYLNFSPGYSGKFILYHLAYLLAALVLIYPHFREKLFELAKWRKQISIGLIVLSLFYANFLLYKDGQAHIKDHERAQAYRPLIEALSTLPKGVVLGNPDVSNMASLFTNHHVYWHQSAYGERVTTAELHDRFVDAKLFFKDSPRLNGEGAIISVFGSTDHCTEYKRFVYLKFFYDLGLKYPYEELCLGRKERREEWGKSLDNSFSIFSSFVLKHGEWYPGFRIDYLVVAPEDKSVPETILSKYFELEKEVEGGFAIYRYIE